MSSIQDPGDIQPRGGDGPNKSLDPSEGESVSGSSAEHRQDEGRGEHGGHGKRGHRHNDDDAPKSASKGINPVQHSE